jgi:hypothetical protein
MNWIDLKDLEKRLAENSVSDKEGFRYLLANWILFGSLSFAAVTEQYGNPGVMVILLLIPVISLIIGYRANQKGDGKEFLKRFISVHFVAGIRIIVIAILLSIPAGLLGSVIPEGITRRLLFGTIILTTGISYYWIMAGSIKKISVTAL